MRNIELQDKTDREIIKLVPKDKEYFGVIIRRYEKRVMSFVRRIGGGTQENIEDIAQNIFIKVYVNIYSYKTDKNFSNWLYGIARNECIDYWRKHKKHDSAVSLEGNEELFAVLRSDDDLMGDIARQYDDAKIKMILDGVEDKYKEVLVLRFLEQKSYEEIGEILRLPTSTVGTLISRGKERFKVLMQKKNESR